MIKGEGSNLGVVGVGWTGDGGVERERGLETIMEWEAIKTKIVFSIKNVGEWKSLD